MDNVVQNISISDIIPSNFQPNQEEKRKIEELAQLIKSFGLLDPILVRPKNGKYEIVLGNDKYQAALIANQKTVPVIIKEIEDEVYSKYSNIDNNQSISIDFLPKETISKEENSDIINLSELSKINLEYERDDVKMNNEQMNNNLNQPNMNMPNQGPTFGGRYFPSLEDEPTNMNMMGGLNATPVAPASPSINNDLNNNLIDLTDLSLDKEPTSMVQPNLNMPPMDTQPTMPMNATFNEPQTNNFEMPNLGANPIPTSDNIINLESLQNNNPAVKPIIEPTPNEPVSMDILNADFGAPTPMPNNMPNQFNMGPSMAPTPDFNIPQPSFNEAPSFVQPNLGVNPTMMPQPEPTMPNPQFNPNFDFNTPPAMPVTDFGINNPVASTIPSMESNLPTTKDVTPVTNTIKNLVTNLEAFGYKINVTEENLPTTSKLIIEIEK